MDFKICFISAYVLQFFFFQVVRRRPKNRMQAKGLKRKMFRQIQQKRRSGTKKKLTGSYGMLL